MYANLNERTLPLTTQVSMKELFEPLRIAMSTIIYSESRKVASNSSQSVSRVSVLNS